MLGVPSFGTTTPGTTCRGDTDACVLPPGKVSTGAAADTTVPRTLSVTAHRWSTRSTPCVSALKRDQFMCLRDVRPSTARPSALSAAREN
jgi:hypothetical protein